MKLRRSFACLAPSLRAACPVLEVHYGEPLTMLSPVSMRYVLCLTG